MKIKFGLRSMLILVALLVITFVIFGYVRLWRLRSFHHYSAKLVWAGRIVEGSVLDQDLRCCSQGYPAMAVITRDDTWRDFALVAAIEDTPKLDFQQCVVCVVTCEENAWLVGEQNGFGELRLVGTRVGGGPRTGDNCWCFAVPRTTPSIDGLPIEGLSQFHTQATHKSDW